MKSTMSSPIFTMMVVGRQAWNRNKIDRWKSDNKKMSAFEIFLGSARLPINKKTQMSRAIRHPMHHNNLSRANMNFGLLHLLIL